MTAPEAAEEWLARRCDDFGRRVNGVYAAVFSGVTDTETRKARMREAITDRHLADAICGKRGGNVETFRAVFQRIYSEAL
jgi:hypothetical protein